MINRSNENLTDVAFTFWSDIGFGCAGDDFVGCLPEHNLAFIYNEREFDGGLDSPCFLSSSSYKDEIPVVGIKQIEGFKNENSEEIDLHSFTFRNRGIANEPANTLCPRNTNEFYNAMNGLWNDGAPMIVNGEPTKFLYAGNPSDESNLTMCNADLPVEDRRMLINFGHFDLDINESNNVIFSITGVEDVKHPCPDVSQLTQRTDELKNLFQEGIITNLSEVQIGVNNLLKIVPNPASNYVEITLPRLHKIKTISLFKVHGQEVSSQPGSLTNTDQLNVENVISGIYFVAVETQNGILYNKKLIVH